MGVIHFLKTIFPFLKNNEDTKKQRLILSFLFLLRENRNIIVLCTFKNYSHLFSKT